MLLRSDKLVVVIHLLVIGPHQGHDSSSIFTGVNSVIRGSLLILPVPLRHYYVGHFPLFRFGHVSGKGSQISILVLRGLIQFESPLSESNCPCMYGRRKRASFSSFDSLKNDSSWRKNFTI